MKKLTCILLSFVCLSNVLGTDTIITRQNNKHVGTVVSRTENGFGLRKPDGSLVVVPTEDISKIIRDNIEYDLIGGMKYQLEVGRPFLPFAVLGIVTGAYAVKSFGDYQNERDRVELERIQQQLDPDYQVTSDKSKTFLAYSVVSALFCAGSFYIAFKPMEVRIPIERIERISLRTTASGISVALHF
ncbi:hypothetical protein JW824_13050 [bacterium]|nr:hypothetical protein [bacterium]RQV93770.1 MAG: hypothetical protein EH221_08840 [bacterium]